MHPITARRLLAVAGLFLSPILALTACEETIEPAPAIVGEFTGTDPQSGFTVYYDLTLDSVVIYQGDTTHCFVRDAYSVVSRNGPMYTLLLAGDTTGQTLTLDFVMTGTELTVTRGTTTFTLTATDTNLADLNLCLQGAGDPAFTCAGLPAVAVGDTITAALDTTDYQWINGYFDPYAITVDTTTTLALSLNSSAFEPNLFFYDSAGNLISQNDDVLGRGAQIVDTVPAGCYRIGVTSFNMLGTGAYTLRIE